MTQSRHRSGRLLQRTALSRSNNVIFFSVSLRCQDGWCENVMMAQTSHHPSAIPGNKQRENLKMNITRKLCLASILALSIVAPVQAQNPKQGDYYAPGPTTPIKATADQLKKNQQGDYYVGEKMILNQHRMAALKKCTHNIAFESDRYVACMSKEGEAP
jgi:hypothetical protein